MKNPTKTQQEARTATQQPAQVIYTTPLDRTAEPIKANPTLAKTLPMPDFEQVAYLAQEDLFSKVMALLTEEGRNLLMEYTIMSYACGLPADQRTPSDIAEMQAGIMLAWGKV